MAVGSARSTEGSPTGQALRFEACAAPQGTSPGPLQLASAGRVVAPARPAAGSFTRCAARSAIPNTAALVFAETTEGMTDASAMRKLRPVGGARFQ